MIVITIKSKDKAEIARLLSQVAYKIGMGEPIAQTLRNEKGHACGTVVIEAPISLVAIANGLRRAKERELITKMMNRDKWICSSCSSRQLQLLGWDSLRNITLRCRECKKKTDKDI